MIIPEFSYELYIDRLTKLRSRVQNGEVTEVSDLSDILDNLFEVLLWLLDDLAEVYGETEESETN
jgi:hypothetical protein